MTDTRFNSSDVEPLVEEDIKATVDDVVFQMLYIVLPIHVLVQEHRFQFRTISGMSEFHKLCLELAQILVLDSRDDEIPVLLLSLFSCLAVKDVE